MNEVLGIQKLTMEFSGLRAVNSVSTSVNKNEIKAIIGPNGAGKTTLFNCITGQYQPVSGHIKLHHKTEVSGLSPHRINRLGIARTFQNIRLFKSMSVMENVLVGCHAGMHVGIIPTILRLSSFKQEEEKAVEKSFGLLALCSLEKYLNHQAASLPYAAQRRLEIARALASNPVLLLLDEPAAGMNPTETRDLSLLLRKVQKVFDLSILLIEHDMGFVMNISDSVLVMDHGEAIAEGTPSEVHQNEKVRKAYLGEDYDA